MKPKFATAILLFISAYSPLFFILAVKDFDFSSGELGHPIIDILLLSITILSIIILFYSVSHIKRGSMAVKIKSIKSRSLDIINYTIPYLFSAFDINLSRIEDIIAIGVFMGILLILSISSQSVFINPLLALKGYGFYDIEYEFEEKTTSLIAISKYDLEVNSYYYVRSISRFLYIITKKKEEL